MNVIVINMWYAYIDCIHAIYRWRKIFETEYILFHDIINLFQIPSSRWSHKIKCSVNILFIITQHNLLIINKIFEVSDPWSLVWSWHDRLIWIERTWGSFCVFLVLFRTFFFHGITADRISQLKVDWWTIDAVEQVAIDYKQYF